MIAQILLEYMYYLVPVENFILHICICNLLELLLEVHTE